MLLHITGLYYRDRYCGKSQEPRAANPEQRSLTEEQERPVEEWVGKRDALGNPPKHKELQRMIVQIFNPEGTRCDMGITTPATF